MSKYHYDENYFQSIDSEDKAYWLGFLYADGCVRESHNKDSSKIKSYVLEITLCDKDRKHLEKFRESIDSDVPIKDKIVKLDDKKYGAVRMCVCCTKMCNDLIKLGCIPRKTYNMSFPNYEIVPECFMRDFIRGYFDGDGCICVPESSPSIIIANFTGMENMLSEIREYLFSHGIVDFKNAYSQKNGNKAVELAFRGDNVRSFLDYIYKDASIYLDRKYNKYIDFYKDKKIPEHKGVYWHERNKAWVATISIKGKHIRLGQSHDLNEAIKMRKEAEILRMKERNALVVSDDYANNAELSKEAI